MDSFDVALQSKTGRDHLVAVVLLYQIIYGRVADAGGLRAYLELLHRGGTNREVAAFLLRSAEFTAQLGQATPAQVLRRNAGEPDGEGEEAGLLPDELAVALLALPAVARRFPILPALFPHGAPFEPTDYRLWLAARPRPRGGPPVSLSVIIVVDDVPARLLRETVASLLATDSPLLEVCLAGRWFDAARRTVLCEAVGQDSRVHLLQAPWRLGPAGLFNAALRRSRADFTALVTPRDRVDPALLDVLATVTVQADLVLSDEDRFDAEGSRQDPHLGAGWDPDRVEAMGCPGLLLVRTAVVRAVGGMRRQGGARDLLLRAASHVVRHGGAGRIVHVPEILLSRPADAPASSGTVRIVHPLPSPAPRASIVIATRDRADLLQGCLDGLLQRTSYPNVEIVIVDNGSRQPDAIALLAGLVTTPGVILLRQPGPFNWAALNNAGVAASSGQVIVLLNNDIDVIEPGWLQELVSQALRPDVGAVGAKLLYPDGRIQHAGVILSDDDHALHRWRFWPGDSPGYRNSLVVTREVVAVTGACLAIRRDVYDAIGGCDAEALPVTWNDVDLCLKVRARSLRVIWTPHARLLHLEQATRGSDDLPENQARFLREQAIMVARWGPTLRDDPFRIANLYPDEEGRRLAVR